MDSHGAPGHQHHHQLSADADVRKLALALGLILGFMVIEVAAGAVAHSLVLLSDAGHMLADALAIGVSLLAIRLSLRPAGGALTYGLRRAEILSAQFNGATLLVLGTLVVYEAITRLLTPPHTRGAIVLAVALAGIVVNLLAAGTLAKANRTSLSIEGSFQHVLTDLYAFIGTAVAAVVILTTGFLRADAIASLLVAGIMFRSSYGLLRDSGRVFLEAAPKGLSPDVVGRAMACEAEVCEVHDLHVWEVSSGFTALSAHVLVTPGCDCHAIRRNLELVLRDRFGVEHTTLQVDHAPSELLHLELSPGLGQTPR